MMFAISWSFATILFFSDRIKELEFRPLFEKYGFIVFQNALLSVIFLIFKSLKQPFLIFLSSFTQKFLCFVIAVPAFSSSVFVIFNFQLSPNHDYSMECFAHKGIMIKTKHFLFYCGYCIYCFQKDLMKLRIIDSLNRC